VQRTSRRKVTQRQQNDGERDRKLGYHFVRAASLARGAKGADMNILWAIIAGLIIGGLARLVLSGRQPIPIWLTIVLGIVGGLIGNWIAGHIGVRHTNGVDWIRHILQVAAAAVLISLVTPFYLNRMRGRAGARYY
jgi:uncharacterized membrane protein YeaQ/YmgE (transglycosylase-associated protein family)